MTSNLPPKAETGVFAIEVSRDIEAPIEKVWEILLDFPSYHEWNPFVRSMTIVSEKKEREADQTPAAGKHLLMVCHIPPTMKDGGRAQRPFEVITTVDNANYRAAWANADYPSAMLRAERWQVLSTVDGKTRYETREVFAGFFAYFVKWFLGSSLQKSFDAMAECLKRRSESGGADDLRI